MKEALWERISQLICKLFGHPEPRTYFMTTNRKRMAACRRCKRLYILKGTVDD
jgi:hypothetical protein